MADPDSSSPSDSDESPVPSQHPDRAPPELPDEVFQEPEKQPLLPAGAVDFLTLGLTWAVLLAGGVFLGYLVDGWLGTSPAFVLVGLALGIAVGVAMTVTRVRKYL